MRMGVVGPMQKWDQPGGGIQIELHNPPPKGHYSNVKELSKYTPWTVVQRSGNRETTR